MRLDHLLSRASEPGPTTDLGSIVRPLTVWGIWKTQGASYHFSVVEVDPGLVAQLVRAQS